MRCVKCKSPTAVIDSRPCKRLRFVDTTRRRRVCPKCEHRFFTLEVLEEPQAVEIKIEKPKKVKKPPPVELDFENMTDEELEAAIYGDS